MIHLEVKSDGLIYLIKDYPEEPPHYIHSADGVKRYSESFNYPDPKKEYEKDLKQFESALASCERILCAHQGQAIELLCRWGICVPVINGEAKPDPGIYAVPNVEWEEGEELDYPIDHTSYPPYKKVAILKETHSTEKLKDIDVTQLKESEDDLIAEIEDIVEGTYFHVSIYPESVIVTEKRGSSNSVVKQFTITRKP